MTVTSVVFDLDGTLVDSSPDIAAALNVAFASLGVRELTAPETLAMLGGGPRVLVTQAVAAVGYSADDAEIDRLVDTYTVAYRANPVNLTAFFADAAKALPELHAQGLKLGVCTNKRTDIAEQVLAHLGVRDLFGSIVGSEKASKQKPDAAHLLETLSELGEAPEGCLYIGDTKIDADTAQAAGVKYVHVSWGHSLSDAQTEIESFAELVPMAAASR